ncbi:hypothetical protein FSPOR_4827 [Fusarium sporotrichioides]|uniref:Integral membrane n=1 Tax=Fusarium sporotrichioides TaxID=5514 RepID=A0A395S9M5_FUSSP|nr:hypothetical protein FSPOR_4827 [Fusarium sporotrichioides]
MAGLQPDIYAALSITWFAAFVALVMRIKARGMMKTKLWIDDYFAIIALGPIASSSDSRSAPYQIQSKPATSKTDHDSYSGSVNSSTPRRSPFAN